MNKITFNINNFRINIILTNKKLIIVCLLNFSVRHIIY